MTKLYEFPDTPFPIEQGSKVNIERDFLPLRLWGDVGLGEYVTTLIPVNEWTGCFGITLTPPVIPQEGNA